MTGIIDDQEFARVLALIYPARYEYFLERVMACQTLWSLRGESGWVLQGDKYGNVCVPVWPDMRFAAVFTTGIWLGTEPCPIGLEEWLNKWIPGIIADQRRVAVFPTPEGKAIYVDAEGLSADLGCIIPVDPEEKARDRAKRLQEAVEMVMAYEEEKQAQLRAASGIGDGNDGQG